MAEATLSQDAQDAGWQLLHAQEEKEVSAGPRGTRLVPGEFVAVRRVGGGSDTLQEQGAETLEALEEQIKTVPVLKTEEELNEPPTPEQALESGKATVYMQTSSGARQAGEVSTNPETGDEPDVRVEVGPPIEVQDLDTGDKAKAAAPKRADKAPS